MIKTTKIPEKEQFEQIYVDAWCPRCKRMTKFVSHADNPKKWICCNSACMKYTTTNLQLEQPVMKRSWI